MVDYYKSREFINSLINDKNAQTVIECLNLGTPFISRLFESISKGEVSLDDISKLEQVSELSVSQLINSRKNLMNFYFGSDGVIESEESVFLNEYNTIWSGFVTEFLQVDRSRINFEREINSKIHPHSFKLGQISLRGSFIANNSFIRQNFDFIKENKIVNYINHTFDLELEGTFDENIDSLFLPTGSASLDSKLDDIFSLFSPFKESKTDLITVWMEGEYERSVLKEKELEFKSIADSFFPASDSESLMSFLTDKKLKDPNFEVFLEGKISLTEQIQNIYYNPRKYLSNLFILSKMKKYIHPDNTENNTRINAIIEIERRIKKYQVLVFSMFLLIKRYIIT